MFSSSSISTPVESSLAASRVRPPIFARALRLPETFPRPENRGLRHRHSVHDRDKRFGAMFDEVLKAEGIEIIRTPWRAPRANAYAERFVRTVRTECLDRIFIVNEHHLESVLNTYINHYNRERPHRGPNFEYPRAEHQSVPQKPRLDRTPRPPRWPYPRIPPEGCVGPSTSTAMRYSTRRQSGSGSFEACSGFF